MADVLIGVDTFDNLTGSAIELSAWTPTGTPALSGYSKHPTDADSAFAYHVDQTLYNNGADAFYLIDDAPASAEQYAELLTEWQSIPSNKGHGPVFRSDPTINHRYWFRPNPLNDQIELYRNFNGGSSTLLDTAPFDFVAGGTYLIRYEVSTNATGTVDIRVSVDGTPIVWSGAGGPTYVDSSASRITTAGRVGMSVQGGTHIRTHAIEFGTMSNPNAVTLDEINAAGPYLYQRAGAGVGSAAVAFSGGFSGDGSPTAIEVRVEDWTTGEALAGLDWSSAGITLGAGTWSGSRTVPGYDGWLRRRARWANETAVAAATAQRIGVGDRWPGVGQSNMRRMCEDGTGVTADGNTLQFEDTAAPTHTNPGYLIPPAANGARAFTKKLRQRLGVTQGFYNFGESSEALLAAYDNGNGYWLDLTAGAAYDDMLQAIAAIEAMGNAGWAGVPYSLGETEGGQLLATVEEERAGIELLIGRLRSALSIPDLPLYIVQTGRDTRAGKDDPAFHRVREAQAAAARTVASVHLAVVAYPFGLQGDGVHYSDQVGDGFDLMGDRLAEFIAYTRGVVGAVAPGPKALGFQAVDATHTQIKLQHGAGTDITSPAGTGWVRITDDGAVRAVSATARIDATTLEVTHAAVAGERGVQLAYGAAPNVTGAPVDDAGLPLWPAGDVPLLGNARELLSAAASYYHGGAL